MNSKAMKDYVNLLDEIDPKDEGKKKLQIS